MGLVNQAIGSSRIFRPVGQVVAGGGMNDLAREGIELTVWPCEGSTRQQFTLNEQTWHIEVFGHDWKGVPTKSCIAQTVDKDFLGLRLVECGRSAGLFEFIPVPGLDSTYNVVLTNHPKLHMPCLAIRELANNGGAYGRRGGAQVALGDCTDESALWIIDREAGEASSLFFGEDSEVCMTTGWPFLQMGAFLTPNGQAPKTVVVLNEANEAANYALQEEMKVVLTGSIPKRSIQTILLKES
jgi:glucosylceramidase